MILGPDGGSRLALELDHVAALPDSRAQIERRVLLRPRALFQIPDRLRLLPGRHERLRPDFDRGAESVDSLPVGVVVGWGLQFRLRDLAGRLRVARSRLPVAGQRGAARDPREAKQVVTVFALLRAVIFQ